MTKSTTYYWVLAALMSVITLIASYVVVPFGAIPFTLQTMAVVLTGLLIPRKYAAVAMLLNAILLFIFKGAFIYSPSFGFIIGFIVAMVFASQNPEVENGWKILTVRAIGMNLIIFLCGLTYMYLALNYLLDSPISWIDTLMSGMIIFLPTDIIKNVVAISLALILKKRLTL
ncbi:MULTISPECIES: biotin transporter BioY [unclassified Aerococcus]|uniref:biotin transporter BioY n=1 Tax=unclassified Aerococcus TaxID=2618060 RepID=UPI0025C35DE6|nr:MULTISPECIES: biotin transporter BioY [unclassified Aerococcus]